MKWILAVVMVVSFMAGNEAFADGCASSALVCTDLSTLDVPKNSYVVHPCTTFDGKAGTWACPGAHELEETSKQPAPVSSSAKKSRGMTGQ